MNKLIVILFLAMIVMMTACHTDYLAYEEPKDMIYLPFTKAGETYRANVSFELWESQHPTKAQYQGFKIAGFPADVDREIAIELVDSLTTAIEGEDFEWAEKIVMPAGEIYTYIPVIVWNRRKVGDSRSDTLCAGFRIVENDHFTLTTLGSSYMQSMLTPKQITKPRWWMLEAESEYLGPYSEELYVRFVETYDALATTNPDVYQVIYKYAGDHFNTQYFPYSVSYLIRKHIIAPLYYYYQEHPHEGVNIPKPIYE